MRFYLQPVAHHKADEPCNCGQMCILKLQAVRKRQDDFTKAIGGRYVGQSLVAPGQCQTSRSMDNGTVSEL